jgi:toxin ParE1/3/4
MRIVWVAPALRDLALLRAYIAEDKPDAARKQVERILAAVTGLATFPEMGRMGRRPGTRELIIGRTPYLVPYLIEVLRVLHARQRWPGSL